MKLLLMFSPGLHVRFYLLQTKMSIVSFI